MPKQDSNEGYVDALRLSERERADILSRLDSAAAKFQGSNRRDGSRFSYQVPQGLVVEITHPGGTITSYLIRPRDLSSRGMNFIHGAFVYQNSPCRFILRSIKNTPEVITGRVVRCRHVTGRVHEIGICFDKTLKLDEYLTLEEIPEEQAEEQKPSLSGSVLYIEDAIVDRELLRFHLRQHKIELTTATTVAEGTGLLAKNRFDVVLINVDQPESTAKQFIDALRAAGHTAGIIAVTGEELTPEATALKSLPKVDLLTKPYPLEQLIAALTPFLKLTISAPTLLSSHWANEEMRPLITTFVHDMRDKVGVIDSQARAGAWAVVQKMSLELKGTAGGYGFATIQQAATELHALSKTHEEVEALQSKIKDLIDLSSAARASIEAAEQRADRR